ncbi:MAG: hydroxyacylglutathione hydrolase [Pseudomonadota bacterium]
MPLEIVTIPCLSDNYAFLARDPGSGRVALIDVPEADPILAELAARGWSLDEIWITHHHWDHVQGLAEVLKAHAAPVTGAADDAHRLPPLDRAVSDGDSFAFGETQIQVWDVSGHTVGHIAFIGGGAAFTADSLMALGCGRVFEGTHSQMHRSLEKFKALPRETIVCSGHEYTAANGAFAVTVDPANPALAKRIADTAAARAAGTPTVPSVLGLELDTNPYLRADDPGIAEALGMPGAAPVDVFSEIRTRKDNF